MNSSKFDDLNVSNCFCEDDFLGNNPFSFFNKNNFDPDGGQNINPDFKLNLFSFEINIPNWEEDNELEKRKDIFPAEPLIETNYNKERKEGEKIKISSDFLLSSQIKENPMEHINNFDLKKDTYFNTYYQTIPFSSQNQITLLNQQIEKKSQPRKYFRVDDAKKHFKVAISEYATEQINLLIKNSTLPPKFKKKLHLPNSKHFTSNVKELDNYKFLNFDLEKVFTYGKTEGNLQYENYLNIANIFKYKKFPEKTKKIKDFLSLKYEDIIKGFYKSKKFEEFQKEEKTKFFNEGMIKEKNISLLQDFGLVKLFKSTKKKRRRDLFSSKLLI